MKMIKVFKKLITVGVISGGLLMTACDEDPQNNCVSNMPLEATEGTTVQCGSHSYRFSVPEDCVDGGCGLIFDVHGFVMSSVDQDAGTDMRALGRKAVERGARTPYVVVQPSSGTRSWSGADDAQVFAVLQAATTKFEIDEDRIHFGGFSQGGWMTYRFVCAYAETIASFGPIAGGSMDCSPPKNPIIHIHGLGDGLVDYQQSVVVGNQFRTAIGRELEEVTLETGRRHTHTRLSGAGYLWEHIQHSSSGGLVGAHCFPGGGGLFGCRGTFDVGEKIIDFYIAHPK